MLAGSHRFLAPLLVAPAVLIAQARDTARVAPLVVTATRTPLSRDASPAAVVVLTGEQLRAEGITWVADALRQLPSMTVAQTGSFGGLTSVFLRGGESKYVKVLVDGVPVNDPGGSFDFGSLTTDNIDRIEIVRGPASVLYGSDAVTGVIQIFTRLGTGAPHIDLAARAGTYRTSDAAANLTGAASGVRYAFGVARHATNGIYAFNSQYRDDVVSGAVRITPDSATDGHLALRYTNFAFHYPTNSAGRPVDSNAVRTQDDLALGLDIGRFVTPRLEARLLLASHDVDAAGDDQPDGPTDTAGYYFTSLDHVRRRTAEARVNARVSEGALLSAGGQVEQEVQRSLSEGRFGHFPVNTSFEASRQNRAAYAQLLSQTRAVSLAMGGRYEHNEKFGDFLTYRAGASGALFASARLRASLGTAFREPTFFENFGSGQVRGNPSLHPERTVSWDAGVTVSPLDAPVTIGVTYFGQRFRDLIDYSSASPAGRPNYFNVGRADAAGLEVESQFQPAAGFEYSASFSHLATRVVEPGFDTTASATLVRGARLLRRPTTSGSAGGGYRSRGGWSIDLRATFVGNRDDRDFSSFPARAVVLPSYTTLDVAAELPLDRLLTRLAGAAVTVRADNLTDRRFQSVYNYNAPGRVVLVGARVGR